MTDFKAKMHQILFRLGLCPRHRWGSFQRSPRPTSWIWGPLHGRGRGWAGKEEGKVRGKWREREGPQVTVEPRPLRALLHHCVLHRCHWCLPSVLWHSWLRGWKSIRPLKIPHSSSSSQRFFCGEIVGDSACPESMSGIIYRWNKNWKWLWWYDLMLAAHFVSFLVVILFLSCCGAEELWF